MNYTLSRGKPSEDTTSRPYRKVSVIQPIPTYNGEYKDDAARYCLRDVPINVRTKYPMTSTSTSLLTTCPRKTSPQSWEGRSWRCSNSYDPIHQRQSNVSIKAVLAQGCSSGIASLTGHFTAIRSSGMRSAELFMILPRRSFPLKILENLKERLPRSEPYVLTHCDLNLGNIIVQDGSLAGILDWEFAAYYPIWYEYVSASWGWTEEDAALEEAAARASARS